MKTASAPRALAAATAALAAAVLASCGSGTFQPIVLDLSKSQAAEPAETTSVRGMTLEEKIGQLFVVAGSGVFLNDEAPAFKELARQVSVNRVGGVIWFRSNVYETAVLNQRLQRLAKIPLLVSSDLEAGAGMRFGDVTWGAWAMALAATGDPALAEKRARATAAEARAIGIAQIFAPVADVNVNADNPVINVRSFGEDPADVSRFVTATVKGLESGGALATLKHFPGHGDTAVDSHRSLPVLPVGRDRLDAVELVPFRAGIAAGVRSIMVAHVSLPALDPTPAPPLNELPKEAEVTVPASEIETKATLPATLSAPVVTELLRNQLGFTGLVVTDSMRMNGVAAYFVPGEAAVRALLVGVDMILMSPDTDGAIQAVVAAVKAGRISEKRINEAVDRILAEKKRLGLFESREPDLAAISKAVGAPETEALEAEIARRSLTLVRAETGVLPLKKEAKLLSLVVSDEATSKGPAGVLTAELKGRVPGLRSLLLDPRSTADDVTAAVDAAKDADVLLVSLFVRTRSGQGPIAVPEAAKAVIPRLLELGKPVVAVSFGSPYLLRDFPALSTYVCAWGTQDVMQKAAAKALFGETGFEGRLPVSIPGLARRGDGITTAPR